MPRKMPWYVPLMFILTAGYLTLEVPFSVHLAGVLGGDATPEDIHQMERFGRTLSGIAAAIAVLGMWYFPFMEKRGFSKVRSITTSLFVGGLTTFATYIALDGYATARAHFSDGQERKDAVIALLAKRTLSEQGMNGLLDIEPAQWNGVVATMPLLIDAKMLLSFSGKTVSQLASAEAARAFGDAKSFKTEFFETRFSTAETAYADYKRAVSDVKDELENLDQRAQDGWTEYKSKMDQAYPRGWPTGRGINWAMAWRKVRFGQDIPVPESWNLRDRGVFIAAVKQKGRGQIFEGYKAAVEQQLGKGVTLPADLRYEAFLSLPVIQKKIREEIDLPKNAVITPGMSQKAFNAAIYNPQLEKAVDEMRDTVSAPAASFERGELATTGKDAVKSVILPALAILLSLTGAVVHIFKFTGYGLQIIGFVARIRPLQAGPIRHVAAIAVVAIAANSFMGMTLGSLKSPEIGRIASDGIYASILERAVTVQPQLAAIGGRLGEIGIWSLFASELPQPRPFVLAAAPPKSDIAPVEVASLESDAILSRIPIPMIRPVP